MQPPSFSRARSLSPGHRLVCMAASQNSPRQQEPPLREWQEQQLRQALKKGRKRIEINQLCQQTQLERKRVLQWLKNPPDMDRPERNTSVQQAWTHQQTERPEAMILLPTDKHYSREQAPIFRTDRPARKFNKAVLSTLETVYESNKSPSEEIIYSIVDLHHVPKRQVVDWFAEKRRQARREAGLPTRPPKPKTWP